MSEHYMMTPNQEAKIRQQTEKWSSITFPKTSVCASCNKSRSIAQFDKGVDKPCKDAEVNEIGMYTDFCFDVELNGDLPEDVIAVFTFLGDMADGQPALPKHSLFETSRWACLGGASSAYFDAQPHYNFRNEHGSYFVSIRTNFKNYESEIEKFLDWVTPYLNKFEGDFLGFSRYEETEEPTLIYMPKVVGRGHQ